MGPCECKWCDNNVASPYELYPVPGDRNSEREMCEPCYVQALDDDGAKTCGHCDTSFRTTLELAKHLIGDDCDAPIRRRLRKGPTKQEVDDAIASILTTVQKEKA
jgi:hypothetical protein